MKALEHVRAELLDCVQVNLAVLADHFHGADAHLDLGAVLRFRPRTGANGLPTVEPVPAGQIAESAARLGIRITDKSTVDGEGLSGVARSGSPAYVVADAHDLPWVPYYRQKHLPHSFLLIAEPDGGRTVVDAYANQTAWGSAVPGTWELPRDVVLAEPAEVLRVSPGPRPHGEVDIDLGDAEAYLAAYASHQDREAAFEQLTLETWLLARSRGLHARFRERRGIKPHAEQDAHLNGWDALVEQTYLAYRRVSRGRAEPTGVFDRLAGLLAADRVVFGPEDATEETGEALRRSVAALVASVLDVAESRLLEGIEFTSLPRFSSFRLVEIVERLESELDADIDPADLVPENLHRVDDLCRIIRTPGSGVAVLERGPLT